MFWRWHICQKIFFVRFYIVHKSLWTYCCIYKVLMRKVCIMNYHESFVAKRQELFSHFNKSSDSRVFRFIMYMYQLSLPYNILFQYRNCLISQRPWYCFLNLNLLLPTEWIKRCRQRIPRCITTNFKCLIPTMTS